MEIVTTIVRYKQPRCSTVFIKYVADNGNAVYVVDGVRTTKEDGNNQFRDLASRYEIQRPVKEHERASDDEIIARLEKNIDPYTLYIDDYNQMKAAERRNDAWRALINAFKQAAGKC